jgi:hypothetical protein
MRVGCINTPVQARAERSEDSMVKIRIDDLIEDLGYLRVGGCVLN